VSPQLLLPRDCITIGYFIQSHVLLHPAHCHDALIVAELNGVDPAFLAGAHDDLDAGEVIDDELVGGRTSGDESALLAETQLQHL
jgi:hypothetical protein